MTSPLPPWSVHGLGDVLEGDLNVVGARAVRGGRGLVIGEDVAVEPQAVCRVVQVDRGQQRRVRDIEGQDRVSTLALVLQVGDDGRSGVKAELVGDRLLGLRGAVVVRG